MKILQWLAGLAFAFSLLIIVFITSFQVAMYSDFGWYERTYERYNVQAHLDMEMDDIMYVTHEMMDYLVGERDDLIVMTTIGGEERSFFGYQDRFHMYEVKVLFLAGLDVRNIATDVLLLALLVIIITRATYQKLIPKSLWIALGTMAAASLALVVIFLVDFSHAFVVFHEIFFDNDLWLFDPTTSYMIRMLPEGLFYDMIMRVLGFFGLSIGALLLASILFYKLGNRQLITSSN